MMGSGPPNHHLQSKNLSRSPAPFDHRHLSGRTSTDVHGHGRYAITFNGEIYNYLELREQLRAKGHSFRTETDTEVLLAAFAEWGIDCLPRLNGMFAFGIRDNQEQTLTLARDHVGIKPLYYAHMAARNGSPVHLVFASEIKAILATNLIDKAIDVAALHQFLTFLWAPDPHTLFRGIKTLPPAHVLTFRKDEISVSAWWDVSFDEIETGRSEAWWQERVWKHSTA